MTGSRSDLPPEIIATLNRRAGTVTFAKARDTGEEWLKGNLDKDFPTRTLSMVSAAYLIAKAHQDCLEVKIQETGR